MSKYDLWGYEVEIDENATTTWYTTSNDWGCECGDCRNFLELARVLQVLDMLNIPPEKATYVCELYPVDGVHCYQFLSYFFPFEPLSFVKKKRESYWKITDIDTMAMRNKSQAVVMSFQKEYAERYDWLVEEFKDWAFTFVTSFLYYQDLNILDEDQKRLYQQDIAAFGGHRTRPTMWSY